MGAANSSKPKSECNVSIRIEDDVKVEGTSRKN
jgi:hypothetical protein